MWLPVYGYHSYCCGNSKFDKLKRPYWLSDKHITLHHRQKDEQVQIIANCDSQAKLNTYIRHHQGIME